MIVCQRLVCWRVRTSRARSSMVALAGLRRSRVRIRQFLRSLKPCSTGARAADRAWFACRSAGVVFLVRVDLYPVMMTGSSGPWANDVIGPLMLFQRRGRAAHVVRAGLACPVRRCRYWLASPTMRRSAATWSR